jgi:hypothetical protein
VSFCALAFVLLAYVVTLPVPLAIRYPCQEHIALRASLGTAGYQPILRLHVIPRENGLLACAQSLAPQVRLHRKLRDLRIARVTLADQNRITFAGRVQYYQNSALNEDFAFEGHVTLSEKRGGLAYAAYVDVNNLPGEFYTKNHADDIPRRGLFGARPFRVIAVSVRPQTNAVTVDVGFSRMMARPRPGGRSVRGWP